jgi:glyoxylase-like metal-dependent hydrolase (beta-lactamase superfamily II)
VRSVLLADNPGPLTLEGTNTWILRDDPDRGSAVVVDPGPDDAHAPGRHRGRRGGVELILLTHRHADHSEGAAALADATAAPVRSVDPAFRTGPDGLGDGDVISVAGVTVFVFWRPRATPRTR